MEEPERSTRWGTSWEFVWWLFLRVRFGFEDVLFVAAVRAVEGLDCEVDANFFFGFLAESIWRT